MRAIQIAITPSRQLRWIHRIMLFWLMILFWQQFNWLWGSIGACLVPLILPLPKNPHAMQIDHQGQFAVAQTADNWQKIQLYDGIILSKWIFYRYHVQNDTQTLLLCADQMSDTDWRYLQSRIRWQKHEKTTP